MDRTNTKLFTIALNELYNRNLEDYTPIDWALIIGIVDEIKHHLYVLQTDSSRIKYLGTVFNEFSTEDTELWFDDIKQLITFTSNITWKYKVSGTETPRLEAGFNLIGCRNTIIIEVYEFCERVYPELDFGEVRNLLPFTVDSPDLFWDKEYQNKKQKLVKDGSVRLNGSQHFTYNYENLTPLYDLCVSENIFEGEYRITDFINCFDLNFCSKVFPSFSRGSQTKFVFILSEMQNIKKIPKFDKVVLASFGIKNYFSIRQSMKPSLVFKAAVNKVLTLK